MEQPKSSIGSIIGIVVIIAIIIMGGLYFWGQRIEESKNREELVTDVSTPEENSAEIQATTEVSSSDEVADIEADLNSTDLNLSGDIE